MANASDTALEVFDPLQALALHESKARLLGASALPDRRLASAVLMLGKLGEPQLREALQRAEREGHTLARQFELDETFDPADLAEARAAAAGLRFVNLDDYAIATSALRTLPAGVARAHSALPFRLDPVAASDDADRPDDRALIAPVSCVWVALANPISQGRAIIERILRDQGLEVRFVASDPEVVERLITQRYGLLEGGALSEVGSDAGDDDASEDLSESNVDNGPARQLVTQVWSEALQRRASDIHVEPNPGEERGLLVRYRIDGVTRILLQVPEAQRLAVINAMKIDLRMDVATNRSFQSGRTTKIFEGRRVDFRGESVPTEAGETVIVRILDRQGLSLDLAKMGMSRRNLSTFEHAYRKPHGAILVTGPVGSGKTSTLYAVLAELNDVGKVIFTVEDPVEYRLPGVQHVSVDPRAGRTFSTSLRSILRAGPNVIMVGEIRDEDTALTAMRATLTGALVFSTLHTPEASDAPIRLIGMGVAPYIVAGGLSAVVNQRLVRVLCEACRETYTPDDEELMLAGYRREAAAAIVSSGRQLHRPSAKGCRRCGGTSYTGRTAIHEVLMVDSTIRSIILDRDRRSSDAIRAAAVAGGMRSLKQDALDKAFAGVTSLAEVRRVVG